MAGRSDRKSCWFVEPGKGGTRVRTGRLVFLAVIAIVVGLVPLAVSGSSAFVPSSSDTVSVCPDSTWSADGDVFSVGVCISAGMTGVMLYNISVTFDSSVIEIMNAEEGPLPQSVPGGSYFYWENPGTKSDSVRVYGIVLEGAMNGPGELATFTFKAKSHGVVRTTDIAIAYSELRDTSNQPILHEIRNGFVTVDPIMVISVCPDSTWKTGGDVFPIGVCISPGLRGVMGYNIAVAFDSSVVEIMNAEEGPLPPSAGETFFWWYDAGVKTDFVHVNGAVLGETMDGPGELFTLTFKARNGAVVRTTDVVITYSVLRDEFNEPVLHETKDGWVRIEPSPTGIETPPRAVGRLVCYPNPFNPTVTLDFFPPALRGPDDTNDVTIRVYSPDGRLVRNLFKGRVDPAGGKFTWDGKDGEGENVASGVYFAVAETDGGKLRAKLVLVR
jgi:hypothetical protein